MRVRGQGDGEFESAVNLLFAVFTDEAIQSMLQEPGGFCGGTFPIGGICDTEFDRDASKARRRRIAAERAVVKRDSVEAGHLQTASPGDQPGGTSPAGVLSKVRLRPEGDRKSALWGNTVE